MRDSDAEQIMIRPPLQADGVEIERLFGAIGDEARRKYRLKPSPLLIALPPGRQFLGPNLRMRQQEWRRQIVPDGKSAKQHQMQLVLQRCFGAVPERLARI